MSNWQYVIIGSDYGFVRNGRQAITWTNDVDVLQTIDFTPYTSAHLD